MEVAAGLVNPAVVVTGRRTGRWPIHPHDGAPRLAELDQLGLVQAVSRLGRCVVARAAAGTDRRLAISFGEPFTKPTGLYWILYPCNDNTFQILKPWS